MYARCVICTLPFLKNVIKIHNG